MTGLGCLSITADYAPLDVLERLSHSREELAGRLTFLRTNSQARAAAVLSTWQRTEVYATWPGEPDHPALLAALALDRGIPVAYCVRWRGPTLVRVLAGLFDATPSSSGGLSTGSTYWPVSRTQQPGGVFRLST
jgi:hypothetical protein